MTISPRSPTTRVALSAAAVALATLAPWSTAAPRAPVSGIHVFIGQWTLGWALVAFAYVSLPASTRPLPFARVMCGRQALSGALLAAASLLTILWCLEAVVLALALHEPLAATWGAYLALAAVASVILHTRKLPAGDAP
ncbi:MAG: hypothetical protein M3Y17_13075 [Actinomycetota bacterium]|nr:hypothetical protein [Actinomycetota bacterium]